LALINAPRPPEFDSEGDEYDAKLLLLSVRNADKSLKPGDATYEQRVEMMTLMTKDAITRNGHTNNVAVGLIDEPTFVGKSDILRRFLLSARLPQLQVQHAAKVPEEVELTFLLGFDTLERLFSPRYYTPPQPSTISAEENMLKALHTFLSSSPSDGHSSRIVCGRRVESSYKSTPALPLGIEKVQGNITVADGQTLSYMGEFLHSSPKKIAIIDIEEKFRAYSSSEVRKLVGEGDVRWKAMVTPRIAEYIEREHLYKEAGGVASV
jgi:nicotinamide-nucleotide adenylyltransferase